jgi:hypothetical protein
MIRQHPWLGVGPGNFGREYPKHMSPSAYETIADPHNFALELWSTMGVFALLAVLVALGAFFWRALKAPPGAATEPEEERTRWEFYIGGMAGLLVGFALNQGNQSPDLRLMLRQSTSADAEALLNGLVAGLRAVLWFATFALFERLPLSPRGRALALAAGVAALLGNLMVSGGIGAPSLAMFLWVAVGLALTSSKTPAHGQEGAPGWGGRVAVMSVTTGFALAYLIYVFYPVTYATSLAWSAMDAAAFYSNDAARAIRQLPREKQTPADFLDDKVVKPLQQATETDPINARWHLHLAQWTAELWKRSPADQRRSLLYSNNALAAAGEALKYDPHGREGYLEKHRLHLFFAQYKKGEEHRQLLDNAATALRELLLLDPTAAPIHYQLARTLAAAGRRAEAVEAAETALYFDDLVTKPPRRLNAWQRFHARILARVAP